MPSPAQLADLAIRTVGIGSQEQDLQHRRKIHEIAHVRYSFFP